MREQMLRSILSDLNGASADIEASAIISSDGLTMAALLPQDVDEDRVGGTLGKRFQQARDPQTFLLLLLPEPGLTALSIAS